MKKLVITSISVFFATIVSFAQLNNAILAFEGMDLKVAKESIDKYLLKEKGALDAKGWLYKGKIYQYISGADSTKPAIKALYPGDATKLLIEAYQKTIEFDKSKNLEYAKEAKEQLESLYTIAFNDGIKNYKNDKFKEALEYMSICQTLKPTDTLAYIVGSQIAIQTKDYESAKKALYALLDHGYKEYSYYKNLLYIASQENKSDDALKVVQLARVQFPNDGALMGQEVNLYIELGRTQEAVEKLQKAAISDVANSKVYYYNLGILYKQTSDNVKAKEYFAKSLAADPGYEGANFMTGFMMMEEGDVMNKKINDMNIKQYNATGKKEEAKRDDLYKKAIPYLEKAYEVSKDENVKKQLTSLYKKFKMDDKILKLN